MNKSARLTTLHMDQRRRWQAGQRVLVESYLRKEPTLRSNGEALLDLIYQEIVLRQEQGENPSLQEYEQRFPDLAEKLRLQFDVHQALEGSSLLAETSAGCQPSLSDTPLPDERLDHEDLVGRTLGDCRVIRMLGQGAMGRVYLGEQTALGRKVALKILRPELVANAITLQRFQSEARAMASVAHPNIVQIYSIGASDGLHYLVMEFIEGSTLRQELTERGRLEPTRALTIMRQVAAALVRAAELGIVHRDVKPDNILLTAKGEAKLTDFGLCRSSEENRPLMTGIGVALGTPLYMSPEQIQSLPVDQRSDIYSFGATCYHMIAGVPPFNGTHAVDVALQHLKSFPAPLASHQPNLPPGLGELVHRMLAKKPAERLVSAQALLDEVDRITATASIPMAQLAPRLPGRSKRRLLLLLASAFLLALGGGFAVRYYPQNAGLESPIPQKADDSKATEPPTEGASDPAPRQEPQTNPKDPDPRDGRGGQRRRHGGRDPSRSN